MVPELGKEGKIITVAAEEARYLELRMAVSSLPLNHLTMPRAFVMPAISTPPTENRKAQRGKLSRAGMEGVREDVTRG